MEILEYNLNNEKVKYLISTDNKLGKLIKFIVSSQLIIEPDGFKCLVKYIIGQQISDKARETIWKRFCSNYKNPNPKLILSIDDSELKQIGLSERKVEYIKSLAQSIVNHEIDFKSFSNLTNEEIIKKLTSIKGIGRWTAEMYLIFSLGREDVLSKGDGTVKRIVQWLYNLDKLPTSDELDFYFRSWNKYATIVSAYFWKSIEMGLHHTNFEVIENMNVNSDNLHWMNYSIENASYCNSSELYVGAVLVSEKGELIASSNNSNSWPTTLLEELKKKNIKEADSLYLTINTLKNDTEFDINCLLEQIKIQNIYLGLPDHKLTSYLPNDPIVNMNNIYRYPEYLQERILKQNEENYLNSKQHLKNCSYFSTKRIGNLLIEKLQENGFILSQKEVYNNKKISELITFLSNKYNINYEKAMNIINEGLKYAFNEKYSSYDYRDDVRSINNSWKENFISICEKMINASIDNINILDVGVGSGNEATILFFNFKNITFVDIAPNGLKKIKEMLPQSKIINSNAESLPFLDDTYDLYVSLRTYNSSFFDVKKSLSEAYRVLKHNGVIIISIANGFLNSKENSIISGLIVPGLEFIDIYRGIDMIRELSKEFSNNNFKNINIYTTKEEIYLTAIINKK